MREGMERDCRQGTGADGSDVLSRGLVAFTPDLHHVARLARRKASRAATTGPGCSLIGGRSDGTFTRRHEAADPVGPLVRGDAGAVGRAVDWRRRGAAEVLQPVDRR